MQYWFCGYDNKGNLFVDGRLRRTGAFVLAELPKNGAKLDIVKVTQKIDWPGAIRWDGKYVVIGDEEQPVIYRFSIRNREASLEGTVSLGKPAEYPSAFSFYKGQVIVPNGCSTCKWGSDVGFYNYPAGGKPTRIISKPLEGPASVVVSPATE
jgi:hypothetical protein